MSVADLPRVLRRAAPEDLARAARALETKPARFDLCQHVLTKQDWPCELIDVEPLLDESATVLLYLGPRQRDIASLRARFRVACELDVLFEQVSPGLVDEQSEEPAEELPSRRQLRILQLRCRRGRLRSLGRAQGDVGHRCRGGKPGSCDPWVTKWVRLLRDQQVDGISGNSVGKDGRDELGS